MNIGCSQGIIIKNKKLRKFLRTIGHFQITKIHQAPKTMNGERHKRQK